MKNKLTLEHLTPYLPYRLKGIFQFNDEKCVLVSIDHFRKQISVFGKTLWNDLDVSEFKPILRPLSDLTKEIVHNGERLVPLEKIQELFKLPEDKCFLLGDVVNSLSDFFFTKDLTDVFRFKTVIDIHQKLLEWHFDVFGLIDKGLAIDINTLKGGQE